MVTKNPVENLQQKSLEGSEKKKTPEMNLSREPVKKTSHVAATHVFLAASGDAAQHQDPVVLPELLLGGSGVF